MVALGGFCFCFVRTKDNTKNRKVRRKFSNYGGAVLTKRRKCDILKISPVGGYGGITMEQHTHEHTKSVLNRMSRAIGHMNAVKKMIEDGRDCSDVLIQLSAIKSEITGVSKVILKDHIDHCIVDAVKENDEDAIENLKGAIDKLL